ncbi:MAG: flagellar biosynthesis anti-sigma factor FlgM [Polymorphobacter sp.]
MIDGVGRTPPARAAAQATGGAGVRGAAEAASVAAAQAPASSSLTRIARDLAAAPPVDMAKVETLRNAIASGAYRPDPEAIAAKMLALEAPTPKR